MAIIKFEKEVNDFLLRMCTVVDTFGDDGKTQRQRYFYVPWWFGVKEEDQETLEIFSYDQMPEDLIEAINDQRGISTVRTRSIEETRRHAGYFPEFVTRKPNPNWTPFEVEKYLNDINHHDGRE